MKRQSYTLVYDGECGMCTRLTQRLIGWDTAHRIEVTPSQSAGVTARFPWIPATAYAEAIQLVGPGGETWQGAAAIEQLFTLLPRGRWIAWVFSVPFMRALADRVYRWVARHRYRLGCGKHCQSRPPNVRFPD